MENLSEPELKGNLKKLNNFSDQVRNVQGLLVKANLANTPQEL